MYPNAKKWLLGLGLFIGLILVLIWLRGKRREWQNEPVESRPQISLHSTYNLYMNEVDQQAQAIEQSATYKRVSLTDQKAVFLATEQIQYGTWSSTLTLDLNTLHATMFEEYPGKGVGPKLATVQFTPNQYGGFDLEFNYADSTSAHGRLIPVLSKPQPEGFTVIGLCKSILQGIHDAL